MTRLFDKNIPPFRSVRRSRPAAPDTFRIDEREARAADFADAVSVVVSFDAIDNTPNHSRVFVQREHNSTPLVRRVCAGAMTIQTEGSGRRRRLGNYTCTLVTPVDICRETVFLIPPSVSLAASIRYADVSVLQGAIEREADETPARGSVHTDRTRS